MLSDVMEHFGLSKTFTQAEGFETDYHRQLLKDLKNRYPGGRHHRADGDVGQWQNGVLGSPPRSAPT